MNQLTYKSQWMKWKAMKLNWVMCLCFFSPGILCFCHLFVNIIYMLFFGTCTKTHYGCRFCCSGLMLNVWFIFWRQLKVSNLKFLFFYFLCLLAVLCVVDYHSSNIYTLDIDFVRMKFFLYMMT